MRKICFILVIISFNILFSQQNETDTYNRVLYEQVKKLPIDNSYSVITLKNALEKIATETKDSLLILDIKNHLNKLDKLKFYKEKKVDDSVLTSDDLKKIRVDNDKFTGLKKYYSYLAGNRFQPVIIIKDDIMSLRFTTQLNNNSWVFKETTQVLVDEKSYSFKLENLNREVLSGSQILETSNTPINPIIFEMLEDIYNGCENVSVRYYGNRIYDFELVKNEIIKIQKLMNLYYKLETSLN